MRRGTTYYIGTYTEIQPLTVSHLSMIPMKNLIAANWKSNKTVDEVKDFFQYLINSQQTLSANNTEVLVCPPFPYLSTVKEYVDTHSLPVLIGAQNCSPFTQGAYTGEVTAAQIADFANFVIIGHSERRKYFNEDEEVIEKKVLQAREAGLRVILCVQDEQGVVYEGVDTVAYEPIGSIGTGKPDDPSRVATVLQTLHEKHPSVRLLYGGSVDKNSLNTYTHIAQLSGFLVGGASLEAETFLHLIAACDTKNS